MLDAFFQNVCELDLVFSFYKVSLAGTFSPCPSPPLSLSLLSIALSASLYVSGPNTWSRSCQTPIKQHLYQAYAILDEVFLAGEIEETSKQVVLDRLDYLEKLE